MSVLFPNSMVPEHRTVQYHAFTPDPGRQNASTYCYR